jgi:uncharacterized protein (DUF305 family)
MSTEDTASSDRSDDAGPAGHTESATAAGRFTTAGTGENPESATVRGGNRRLGSASGSAVPTDLDAAHRDSDIEQPDDPTDDSVPASRNRTAILALIGACLLLTGVAIGVIARIPLQHKGDAAPNAVDVGFCQDMSVHHAQAVEMASLELSGGSDTDIKRLAYDIMTSQENQAGRMQGWLQLWQRPTVDPDGYMGWMAGPDTMHSMGAMRMSAMPTGPRQSMPGMASAAEMDHLRQLTGPAQDTLFLQLMLRHHQGGIPMVTYASTHAGTDAVRTLADSMNTTQQAEIRLMTHLLTTRGAPTLPMT